MRAGTKLWIWKNGDHYLVFDNEFPCFSNGDPITLGPPIGVGYARASYNGREIEDAADTPTNIQR
jgi:hypothetical protein